MSTLTNTFSNIFNTLRITNYTTLGVVFGYMLSIQLYHLIFDVLVFFIHLLHEYLEPERWLK